MTERRMQVLEKVGGGLRFNVALGAVSALGHLHQQPSWEPVRIISAVALALILAVCLEQLRPQPRLGAVLAWFRSGRSSTAALAGLAGVMLIVGLLCSDYEPAAFTRRAQAESQLNLWLQAVIVCLFWPAVWNADLRAERANRKGLIFNALILLVVVQAGLHAARLYEFHDGRLFGLPLACSVLAFAGIVALGSFFGWFLTRDAVAASQSASRSPVAPPDVVEDAECIGIAASGGGIRAAVVATGVLSTLRRSALWKRVGFISAVSGGSWALANFLRAGSGAEQADAAVASLRASKDYIRRGTGTEWIARPVAVAIVGTGLQLVSLLLGFVLIIVFGVYLDELQGSNEAVFVGKLLAALREHTHALPNYPTLPEGLAKLDTLFSVGLLLGAVGLAFVCLGCGVILLTQLRLVWRLGQPLEALAVSLVFYGAVLVVAVVVPVIACASASTLVGLVVIAAIGGAYIKEWRLQGLGVASIFAAVAGFIGVLLEKVPFIEAARAGVDGAVRTLIVNVIKATNGTQEFLTLAVKEHLVAWPTEEEVGLSLLVIIGALGLTYFGVSLLIRLEAVGLGSVWRSWVATFSKTTSGEGSWPSSGPTPIINMTVNAPAEPFKVAHFEADPTLVGGPTVGYAKQGTQAPTLSLLDAISVSSAALNSQAGRYVSAWLRPVLSVLSLKLGRWLPHPGLGGEPVPALSLQYMNRELLGWNALGDAHLFLSDGGHFENLGAYALLLRGVPTLVVLDAAADPRYEFGDLSRFIELARYRGYSLHDLDLPKHVPPTEAGARGLRVPEAVVTEGELRLDVPEKATRDAERRKKLPRTVRFIYAKLGLVQVLSPHVYAYARQNAGFPQQSTADQFFDESQFEAYLEIGERLGAAIVTAIETSARPAVPSRAGAA